MLTLISFKYFLELYCVGSGIMYVCVYVYMCVCVYVCLCTCIYIYMVGGKIFRTYPDRPWDPNSRLYSGYLVFLGVKPSECGVDNPQQLASRLKKE